MQPYQPPRGIPSPLAAAPSPTATPNTSPMLASGAWRRTLAAGLLSAVCGLLIASGDTPASELYINGVRSTGLKAGEMVHCTVKFDSAGNIHILSPGYKVVVDAEGRPLRIEGHSDLAGAAGTRRAGQLSKRYVLAYEPNAKVPFTFDIQINGQPFKAIDLGTSSFTVDLMARLKAGDNAIRVIGKPAGNSPPLGGESDVVKLRIFRGDERADGTFVAQLPAIWELVRSAVDRDPIDRAGVIEAE